MESKKKAEVQMDQHLNNISIRDLEFDDYECEFED